MAHYGTKRESAATVSINDQSFSRDAPAEREQASPLRSIPRRAIQIFGTIAFVAWTAAFTCTAYGEEPKPSPTPAAAPTPAAPAAPAPKPAAEAAPAPAAPAAPADKAPSSSAAKNNPQDKAAPSPAGDQLSVDEARLADRYKRLEEVVGRLAEVSAATDPRRAKLLRDAIAQSREQDINVRFESVVKLLQDERLSAAATNQVELQKELDNLLSLLLKADRDKELKSERERVKEYLKEVGRLIREQKGVRARTEGGDDLKALTPEQQRIAGDTGKLGGSISKNEGDKQSSGKPSGDNSQDSGKQKPGDKNSDSKEPGEKKAGDNSKPSDKQKPGESPSGKPSDSGRPSEGGSKDSPKSAPQDGQPSGGQPGKSGKSSPSQLPPTPGQPGSPSQNDENNDEQPRNPPDPADQATKRLKAAQQQMEEALKKLNDAQRKGAADRQEQAVKELEIAKAELERVLRQLREEELERTLTQLAARFRHMLEMQTTVYDGTVRLDKVPPAERTHDHEIESARLSREESQIVHEADKALSLLREEGSSVAFPEAVEQMRDDMRQVTERLAAVKVDRLTQGIEQDIIAALEETIAALDKSIKDLEKNRTPPGQMPMAGKPEDQPLVDKLEELKMIRSLQMRINIRTKRYGDMIKGDQAETPDLLKSLQDLADRQQRVYRATDDLQRELQRNRNE
jgi:hypothetical protein